MDGGRHPPAIGVSFKRMHRMAIAGAGRREARRAECEKRGGKRGLRSREGGVENGRERDRRSKRKRTTRTGHTGPSRTDRHASRTNHRKHPRKDRINPPGRAAQGAKPHTLTPFQRETPPKWTKSEKFSLLLRENRQQTETRYGIQFQGD